MKQPFRIGLGHDIHALAENRDLWLGGVKIPYKLGLMGHSDADALIHAIIDALLGALALEDIGQLFPDTDKAYKNISSVKLLKEVVSRVEQKNYGVGNIDCIIHCEAPKIAPYRAEIKKVLSGVLKISENQISIKAGTNEGFGAVGKGLAIECEAVAMLVAL